MADLSQDADFAGVFSNQPASAPMTSGTNLANDPDFSGTFNTPSALNKNIPLMKGQLESNYSNPLQDPNFQNLSKQEQLQRLEFSNVDPSNTSPLPPSSKGAAAVLSNMLVPEFNAGSYALNALTKPAVYGAFNAGMGALQNPDNPLSSALIQGGIGAAGGLVSGISPLLKTINPNEVASSIQAAHDALKQGAENAFSYVSSEAANRGIDSVPIDSTLLERIKNSGLFPNTKPNNALLEQAQTGNYNALRDLQSDLWTRSTKAMSSENIADNNLGEEMMEARDDINKSIQNHLSSTGNDDLANLLNSARSDWSTLKNTYYNPNLPRAIPKLVDPNIREVPDNILNVLSKNSLPMQNLRNANPDVINALNTKSAQDTALKWGKRVSATAAGGAALGGGIAALYHYL